jgi:hypothetical protein
VQYDFPEYLVVKQQQSCDTQPTEFQYISTSTIEDAHYMPFIIDKKGSVNDSKIASLQNEISLKKAQSSTLTKLRGTNFFLSSEQKAKLITLPKQSHDPRKFMHAHNWSHTLKTEDGVFFSLLPSNEFSHHAMVVTTVNSLPTIQKSPLTQGLLQVLASVINFVT